MKGRKGKIYFVSAPGRIKIGFTTRPEARLAQLRYTDFEELTVIGTVDSCLSIEGKLHALVEDYRIKGEWFKDCPEVRAVVDDFISGKLSFESMEKADASTAPPWPESSNPLADFLDVRSEVRKSAIARAESLLAEIAQRAERKEDIKDLVKQACFLAEKIIVPLVYGSKRT